MTGWQRIETAPKDGTLIWTYTAEAHGLPAFQSPCTFHPDAGFCTDELRPVTHWRPIEDVWLLPPEIPQAYTVIVFSNGMIAVYDKEGHQIPELQGKDTTELREKIRKNSLPSLEWLEIHP